MPTIVKENRYPQNRKPHVGELFGQAFSNIGQQVGQGVGQYLSGKAENEKLKKLGFDIEGIQDPQTRAQVLADQMQYGRKLKQSRDLARSNDEGYGPQSRSQLPGFLQEGEENPLMRGDQTAQNRMTKDQVPEEEYGNQPQPATEGKKRRILNPEQMVRRSQQVQKQYNDAGIPLDPMGALDIVKNENQLNKDYNSEVEADTEQRVQAQEKYGNLAKTKLSAHFPDASDDLKSIFAKKGEEAALKYKSQAEIEQYLSKEVRNFKNTVANIKESLPSPTIFNKIKSTVLGTNRDFDKVKNDIKWKLKPFLDKGLYDEARYALSQLDYGPEERELILSDLGKNAKLTLSQMPDIGKQKEKTSSLLGPGISRETKGPDLAQVQDNLSNILTKEPDTNLILLRRAFREKGIEWDQFKDMLNNMEREGHQFTEDQTNMLDKLDTPPLDNLGKILHGLRLKGI